MFTKIKSLSKIKCVKLNENSIKSNICLDNLRIADKKRDLEYFIACSYGWFKVNPNSNYQNFEKFLRNNDFDTHLIAAKIKNIDDAFLQLPHNNKSNVDLKYRCIFSCRSKEDALEELHNYWLNYEENYNALEFAGDLSFKKSEDIDSFDSKNDVKAIKYDEDRKNVLSLLSNNELKLEIETLFPNDVYNRLIEQAKYTMNIIPKEIKVITFSDNSYIFTLAKDEETFLTDLCFLRKPNITELELVNIKLY